MGCTLAWPSNDHWSATRFAVFGTPNNNSEMQQGHVRHATASEQLPLGPILDALRAPRVPPGHDMQASEDLFMDLDEQRSKRSRDTPSSSTQQSDFANPDETVHRTELKTSAFRCQELLSNLCPTATNQYPQERVDERGNSTIWIKSRQMITRNSRSAKAARVSKHVQRMMVTAPEDNTNVRAETAQSHHFLAVGENSAPPTVPERREKIRNKIVKEVQKKRARSTTRGRRPPHESCLVKAHAQYRRARKYARTAREMRSCGETVNKVDTHARRVGSEDTETHAERKGIDHGTGKRELTVLLSLTQDSDSETSHKE